MSYIEGVTRNQLILFPESIDDYIEEDNPIQFIDAFVDSLDLGELGFKYSLPEATGRPPYNPADMLKLYLYGYLNRVRSSRSLEKESHRNLELMWLLKKLTPDFKTIADFRKDNKKAIKRVCREFTLLCKRLDLFGGELVAIDGSKFKAVNSKKRNFNEAKLKKAIKEIDEKVDGYLAELEDNDKEEAYVSHPDAEDIRARVMMLKERGRKYRELLKELKDSGETQISLTDPDSRAMLNNQRVEVCYNVQTTVDSKHKLIIDHEVTNKATDHDQLSQMSKRAKEILGVDELEVLADKGYYDAKEIKECVDNGITPYIPEPANTAPKDVNIPEPGYRKDKFRYHDEEDIYVCPEGSKLTFRGMANHHGKMMRLYKSGDCAGCNAKGKCTINNKGRIIYRWEHEEILEDMRHRVKANGAKVKMRQWLSEHPFGTIKRSFNQGYMLLKGLEKVGAESSISVLAYNIKRVINIVGLKELVGAVG
jgi:transposase